MGLAPGLLPGRVRRADGAAWFSQAWPTVPDSDGLDAIGILQAAADGKIDTLVLLGADPLSDVPDRRLAERALTGFLQHRLQRAFSGNAIEVARNVPTVSRFVQRLRSVEVATSGGRQIRLIGHR